jgi:hypothetical protein
VSTPEPELPGTRDTVRTPWGWLRGFAYFLLAWPLLALLAGDYLDGRDWGTLAVAILGPPAIGGVLLCIERFLTVAFGAELRTAPQPVPSVFRDVSNCGMAYAILMTIDVVIVTVDHDDGLFGREELAAGRNVLQLLALFCGTFLGLRLLHRAVHGPPRLTDLGPAWDASPSMIRFGGYLALIPMLLACRRCCGWDCAPPWRARRATGPTTRGRRGSAANPSPCHGGAPPSGPAAASA